MSYLIYRIVNKINQKCYVGQTKQTLTQRWQAHKNNAFNKKSTTYNTIFSRAIRKYGINNWELEILEEYLETIEATNEAEKWWIGHFGCNVNDNNLNLGYNSTEGGIPLKFLSRMRSSPKAKKAQRQKRSHNTSGYIGIFFNKKTNYYCGVVAKNKHSYRTRFYKDIIKAAKARDFLSLKLLGSESELNFPINENEFLKDLDLSNLDNIKISEEQLKLELKNRYIPRNQKRKNGKNKYLGVNKENNSYKAAIYFNGHSINIGQFDSEEKAAIARDKKALELWGPEKAILNFPDRLEEINNFKLKDKHIKSAQYIGVSFSKIAQKYHAYINIKRKRISLGLFSTPEEAAIARDKKAIMLFDIENVTLNIPIEQHQTIIDQNKKSEIKYKGVCFEQTRNSDRKYHAYINIKKKRINIGYFSTAEEAALARDLKALELLGSDKVILNFESSCETYNQQKGNQNG